MAALQPEGNLWRVLQRRPPCERLLLRRRATCPGPPTRHRFAASSPTHPPPASAARRAPKNNTRSLQSGSELALWNRGLSISRWSTVGTVVRCRHIGPHRRIGPPNRPVSAPEGDWARKRRASVTATAIPAAAAAPLAGAAGSRPLAQRLRTSCLFE